MTEVASLRLASGLEIRDASPMLTKIDSVLDDGYYYPKIPKEKDRTWGRYATEIMRLFRHDLLSVRNQIERLTHDLPEKQKPLTACRILEVLIWMAREPHSYYRTVGT